MGYITIKDPDVKQISGNRMDKYSEWLIIIWYGHVWAVSPAEKSYMGSCKNLVYSNCGTFHGMEWGYPILRQMSASWNVQAGVSLRLSKNTREYCCSKRSLIHFWLLQPSRWSLKPVCNTWILYNVMICDWNLFDVISLTSQAPNCCRALAADPKLQRSGRVCWRIWVISATRLGDPGIRSRTMSDHVGPMVSHGGIYSSWKAPERIC